MLVPLQPLSIPSTWTVEFNDLRELDPSLALSDIDALSWFTEDLLQLRNEHRNRILDVGWYPMGNMERGEFGLVVHEGDFHGPLLWEHRTRDRLALVSEIERLLDEIAEGRL